MFAVDIALDSAGVDTCPDAFELPALAYNAYTSALVFSLIIAVRQVVPSAVGLTQASIVILLVRSSLALSATVTQLLVPLNVRSLPNLPVVDRVAPVIVPFSPLPEPSLAPVPLVSSKPQAPTRP